jgi:hypothetical protein
MNKNVARNIVWSSLIIYKKTDNYKNNPLNIIDIFVSVFISIVAILHYFENIKL